ncbi:hypothetical protein JTE90_006881 [Oedothorax gibbosus]|uniref:Uncharacterized protein n=1 Tax=Oedothorax gibbosus TaxID=931172 RepID=A0AAV6VPY7_9ARAC|nr:hypothetical protein JTE90_006881 [Oedothorax gibbosus]
MPMRVSTVIKLKKWPIFIFGVVIQEHNMENLDPFPSTLAYLASISYFTFQGRKSFQALNNHKRSHVKKSQMSHSSMIFSEIPKNDSPPSSTISSREKLHKWEGEKREKFSDRALKKKKKEETWIFLLSFLRTLGCRFQSSAVIVGTR